MSSRPISRNSQQQEIQFDIDRQLILYDPVLRGIFKVTRQKTWRIALLALAVYAGAYFGLGWLSSSLSGVHAYISMFLPREFVPIIINFFIVAPIIWVYYSQESLKISRMFQELSSSGIFSTIRPDGQSVHEFFQKQIRIFNTKKRYLLILIAILLTTLLLLISWVIGLYDPHNPWRIGKLPWWFEVNRVYFIGVFLPLTFLNYYMSLWFFVRRAIAVTILNEALNNFNMTPKFLDPDKANGLSPIGLYVTKAATLMAVYGFWFFEVFFYPTFFGGTININLNSVETFAVYLLLAPLVLYLPVRKLHQVMSTYRSERLEAVAQQIRLLIAATEQGTTLPNAGFSFFGRTLNKLFPKEHRTTIPQETIESLYRKYQLFEQEYRQWPFRKFEVSGYIFTVALPLMLSLIQAIGQLISLSK